MNRPDIIHALSNQELVDRYRLDRGGIEFLEDLLRNRIQPPTRRHNSVSAIEKILVTLRFLATGGIQLNDGDLHHVSQPTVSNIITEVIDNLSAPDIVSQFVTFPTTMHALNAQCQEFFGLARFPRVVGVIDGTHIRIKAPSEDEASFVNRKGFHSINVQLVFNAFDEITNVVAGWPGSCHDSRILQTSGLCRMFEEGHVPNGSFHLLGDSGYGCRRWLLTPYLNPLPGEQTAYNRAHKITRSKVERGIGQLKRRFGVLHGEIRMRPEKACKVVVACVVLHNICKRRRIPFIDEAAEDNHEQQPDIGPQEQRGLRYRDHFTNTYFQR